MPGCDALIRSSGCLAQHMADALRSATSGAWGQPRSWTRVSVVPRATSRDVIVCHSICPLVDLATLKVQGDWPSASALFCPPGPLRFFDPARYALDLGSLPMN